MSIHLLPEMLLQSVSYEVPFWRSWPQTVLAPSVVGTVAFGWWYSRYCRVRFGIGAGVALGAVMATIAWMATAGIVALEETLRSYINRWPDEWLLLRLLQMAGCFVGIMFGWGMVVKCFLGLVRGHLTADERALGMRGVRAWLSPMGTVSVVCFALLTHFTLGWSLWWTVLAPLTLLLAYPGINTLLHGGEDELSREAEDLTEERRRVLALVEAGKISGEDGAELIGALGLSRATKMEKDPGFSMGKRIMLLGGLLLVAGICLPWFEVNAGKLLRESLVKMHRMTEGSLRVPTLTPSDIPIIPGTNNGAPTVFKSGYTEIGNEVEDIVVKVRGGDLRYGMGWVIFGLGMAAAVLPLLWMAVGRGRELQRGIVLASLIAGTVVLIYQLTEVLGVLGAVEIMPGGMLVVAGFAVVWVGALQEYVRFVARRGAMAYPAGTVA